MKRGDDEKFSMACGRRMMMLEICRKKKEETEILVFEVKYEGIDHMKRRLIAFDCFYMCKGHLIFSTSGGGLLSWEVKLM